MSGSKGLLAMAVPVLAALALMPGAAVGQTVVGRVVEEGVERPLSGAFVVLEDSAGARHGAVLAGEDGRFVLRAPAPGRYRLVARLIGYADQGTELFALAAEETVERRLEVRVRAISLEGIRAEVGTRCRGGGGGSGQTARLWEEARKALEIAEWGETRQALQFHIVRHRRELDAASLRVTTIRETGRRGYYAESPYQSIPAERLESGGYIQPATTDGLWDHFGPDGEVLLSGSFLDTHCFRVEAGGEDRVGLGFEPVPGRRLPDIEGTLWLDRGSAELERLEFRYVNLPYPHDDWPQVGGVVEFERLSTGMWIVRRWHIRMPLAAERTGGYGDDRARLTLRSLVEDGAVVTQVRDRGGRVLAESSGAALYGVVEADDGRPLEGATVTLVPQGQKTRTGPDGVYRLTGLPSGTFTVEVTHPYRELLGGEPVSREVVLEAGRATRAAVAAPLAPLAAALCGDPVPADPVVVHGVVRDPAGSTPVPGAVVRVRDGTGERRFTTDADGRYALCVERADAVQLVASGPASAVAGPWPGGGTEVRIPAGPVARADLTLDPASVSPRVPSRRMGSRGERWSNAIIGTVLREGDGSPVPGAMVTIRDEAGTPVFSAVTNDDGQFRFQHPGAATRRYTVAVEHVGFAAPEHAVTFGPGEQLEVEVRLSERAIEVDPIVVTQRRSAFLVDVGFYDRIDKGAGLFVERAEIERRRPSRLTDLLQGRSGFRVVRTGAMQYDVRLTQQTRVQGECQPAIYVDGRLARDGGEPRTRGTAGGGELQAQPQLSDIVSPDHVEAIEAYSGPAGLPLQYGGANAACGVVAIWTRR